MNAITVFVPVIQNLQCLCQYKRISYYIQAIKKEWGVISMPWCPNCKTEYRDGFTTCADCNVDLVEELETLGTNNDYEEVIALEEEETAKRLVEFLKYSQVTAYFEYLEENKAYSVYAPRTEIKKAKRCFEAFYKVELENLETNDSIDSYILNEEPLQSLDNDVDSDAQDSSDVYNIDETPTDELISEDRTLLEQDDTESIYDLHKNDLSEVESNDASDLTNVTSPAYVKKSDQYKDLKSTAITFLVFGIAGLIFVALNVLETISIINGTFGYFVMSIVFVGFIIVGINAVSRAKKAAADSILEEELTTKINAWLDENVTEGFIQDIKDDSLSDEINFIRTMDRLKSMVTKALGEMDDSYLEYVIEEYYNKNFDSIE